MFAAKARAARDLRRAPAECTTLAVLPSATAQGRILIAQNWDWLAHTRETVVVLEAEQDDGPRYVTVVEAGLLAKFGLNSAGVGVLTNALVCDGDKGEPGVPYHVILRSLHDATSITDALTRLQAAVAVLLGQLPAGARGWAGDRRRGHAGRLLAPARRRSLRTG